MQFWLLVMVWSYQHICHVWPECQACAAKAGVLLASTNRLLWSLVLAPSGLLYAGIDPFHFYVDLNVLPVSLSVSAILNHNVLSKALVAVKVGAECRRLDVNRYVGTSNSWLERQGFDSYNLWIITNESAIQICGVWNIRDGSLQELIVNLVGESTSNLSHCCMTFIDFIDLLQTLFEISLLG